MAKPTLEDLGLSHNGAICVPGYDLLGSISVAPKQLTDTRTDVQKRIEKMVTGFDKPINQQRLNDSQYDKKFEDLLTAFTDMSGFEITYAVGLQRISKSLEDKSWPNVKLPEGFLLTVDMHRKTPDEYFPHGRIYAV